MEGQPRSKTASHIQEINETAVPLRLFVGVIYLVIGVVLCLLSH